MSRMANIFQLLRARFPLRPTPRVAKKNHLWCQRQTLNWESSPSPGGYVPCPGKKPRSKAWSDYHRTRDIAGLLPEDGVSSGPLRIDYWARLSGDELVDGDSVLSLYREYEINLKHPRAVHGRSHPGRVWLDLEQAGSDELFADLVVSLQLADHSGPVEKTELTRFNSLYLHLRKAFTGVANSKFN
ncbi:MAG: hypothetical protein Ct9H300mP14_11660 [Gammaproteobacteria bacterium]|nr:MAG: hypothetical protein Ct9H300mP14_11660 [Gammaproteobacteria bacterium]